MMFSGVFAMAILLMLLSSYEAVMILKRNGFTLKDLRDPSLIFEMPFEDFFRLRMFLLMFFVGTVLALLMPT